MLKLGDIIEIGDDTDGATLCGDCQNYFKGDGELDTCNECNRTVVQVRIK
tara:strand:- start:398 stop:547 length:150 start_codon:yes stop_codon:yes gene_type:complete